MNGFLNWVAVLWLAGAACYLLTLLDGRRRTGFGGGDRQDAGRQGRFPPRTDGSASGDSYHERLN